MADKQLATEVGRRGLQGNRRNHQTDGKKKTVTYSPSFCSSLNYVVIGQFLKYNILDNHRGDFSRIEFYSIFPTFKIGQKAYLKVVAAI